MSVDNIECVSNAVGSVRYATPEEVLAHQGAEPLSEDYHDEETGLSYRIEGLAKFHAKVAAMAAAAELSERVRRGAILVKDMSGEQFIPTDEEIEAAVLASKCVIQPKLGEMQWLATLGQSDLLARLYLRILICNREIGDGSAAAAVESAREALDGRPFSATTTNSA
ncbi:MAG: hypothetical protein P4L33_19650 [Capsulimonadaceae bacterium]|nr:hypothetical protein [Capsulimonadaceae bacterium]